MTVRKLKEILSKYDDNDRVLINYYDSDCTTRDNNEVVIIKPSVEKFCDHDIVLHGRYSKELIDFIICKMIQNDTGEEHDEFAAQALELGLVLKDFDPYPKHYNMVKDFIDEYYNLKSDNVCIAHHVNLQDREGVALLTYNTLK